MPDPGLYVTCPDCSVTRNVRSAPRCMVCADRAARELVAVQRKPRDASRLAWQRYQPLVPRLPRLSDEEAAAITTPLQAIQAVVARHEIPLELVLGHNRNVRAIEARFELIYVLRTLLRLPITTVGRVMQRHHSTVLYAVFQYENAQARKELSTDGTPAAPAAP